MNENIRPVIAADESEPFCVVEPLNFTFYSRHVPYSGRTVDPREYRGPQTDFSSLGFATAIGKGRWTPDVDLLPMLSAFIPVTLALELLCASSTRHVKLKTNDSISIGLQKQASLRIHKHFPSLRVSSTRSFNGARFSSPATTETRLSLRQ